MDFFTSEIAKHHQSLYPSQPRDFIDVYLTEMRTNGDLTTEDLACVMADFLAAGTETSSTTLKWILLYLTLHPSVQEKSREEIKRVLGSEGRCDMSQLKNLPYTLSVITEVQRVARVAPISLMHELSKTTKLGDYIFPKGSVWCANLSYITHDPENFKNPFEFNPDRWIGPDGKFQKNEKMIPFGIGKRICMGELLARNEIFLFTVNLLQKIRFSLPKHKPVPSLDSYNASLTRIPDDFYLRFEKC